MRSEIGNAIARMQNTCRRKNMKECNALSVTGITKIAILVSFENSSQSWRDINESRHSRKLDTRTGWPRITREM
jgi:hypothetical protein